MLKYQVIPGLTVNNPALPVITPRPEDVMASVPGWALLLDPEFVAADKLSARNRAAPNNHSVQINSVLNTEPWAAGGPLAFGRAGTTQGLATYSQVPMDPTQWSFFIPFRDTGNNNNTTEQQLLAHGSAATLALAAGDILPSLVLSADRTSATVREYHGASPVRPTRLTVAQDFRTGPTLLMLTFSIAQGLRLFANGKQIAANAADKRPLNKGYLAGQWGTMWGVNFKAGMQGVLNIDLGAPENAGHRKVIEDFMLAKYGITRAV